MCVWIMEYLDLQEQPQTLGCKKKEDLWRFISIFHSVLLVSTSLKNDNVIKRDNISTFKFDWYDKSLWQSIYDKLFVLKLLL